MVLQNFKSIASLIEKIQKYDKTIFKYTNLYNKPIGFWGVNISFLTFSHAYMYRVAYPSKQKKALKYNILQIECSNIAFRDLSDPKSPEIQWNLTLMVTSDERPLPVNGHFLFLPRYFPMYFTSLFRSVAIIIYDFMAICPPLNGQGDKGDIEIESRKTRIVEIASRSKKKKERKTLFIYWKKYDNKLIILVSTFFKKDMYGNKQNTLFVAQS